MEGYRHLGSTLSKAYMTGIVVQDTYGEAKAAGAADLEAALALDVEGKDLATVIAEKSGKIGEKLSFRRFVVLTKTDEESFGAYSRMGGKMSALVKLSASNEEKARDYEKIAHWGNKSYASNDFPVSKQ